MERTQAKVKYIGEIAVILCLEIIMLLFRMVQPIVWPATIPLVWQKVGNELIFSSIEFGLIIVIVAHFIFKISFKELGLTSIKPSVTSLVINLGFVGMCVGVSFFINQFSKVSSFNGLEIALQIGMNFIVIAIVREMVFRGFLFQSIFKLTNGNGVVAGVISGVLFALTCIPSILTNLSVVHMQVFLSALVIPLVLGIYLGLIYHYGRNLGLCILIQGVSLSLTTLETDLFINLLAGVYGVGLLIYLVYKIVKYSQSKHDQIKACLEDVTEKREIEEDVQPIEEEPAIAEQTPLEESPIQNVEQLQEEPLCEESPTTQTDDWVEEVEDSKGVEVHLEESETQEIGKQDLIEASEENEAPLKDEKSKVVDLEERKQKMAQVLEEEDLEITVIMPCITDEMLKEKHIRFEARGTEHEIQPEPNFIAHLEQSLGEFEGVYRQIIPTEMPVDVLYFSGEKYDALVTNGMRAMVMSVPPVLEEYKQAELMMFVDKSFAPSEDGGQEDNAWLIKLITDLALYPKQMNTYLGWGHIVGNGEDLEPYDTGVAYCGALVYPPMVQENFAFYRYNEKDRNIFIYNVMPLFKEELKFIQEHSSDQFINLMSQMGISQVVHPNRSNVIERMKK